MIITLPCWSWTELTLLYASPTSITAHQLVKHYLCDHTTVFPVVARPHSRGPERGASAVW